MKTIFTTTTLAAAVAMLAFGTPAAARPGCDWPCINGTSLNGTDFQGVEPQGTSLQGVSTAQSGAGEARGFEIVTVTMPQLAPPEVKSE